MRKLALTALLPVFLASATASAHFNLMAPTPTAKVNTGGGKGARPCGPDTGTGDVTPVTGGSELTITLAETVAHDGFYRVALSIKARTELPPDNVVYDSKNVVLPPNGMPSGTSDHADFEAVPKFPVLADNMFPHKGAPPPMFTGKVTLPNVTCDKCTLQVIEFMTPHGYNGPEASGGGYFYHHCADLKITADPNKPIFDPNGAGGGGAGGSGGAGGAAAGSGGLGGTGTAGVATGGTPAAGAATGGTGVAMGGTTTTTGGVAPIAGTTTTPAAGTGGTGVTPQAASTDSGGCGIANHTQGGASILAALGLAFALVRRRRSR
jgi:uncharacterized protein (TIGR03382 family)